MENPDTVDRLTLALRIIREEVVKRLKSFPDEVSFKGIPFDIFKEVLIELGFEMEDTWESNGWENDTWVHFHNHNKKITYCVYSSWYESYVDINKIEYDTKRN